MKKAIIRCSLFALMATTLIQCTPSTEDLSASNAPVPEEDPLPSWNEGSVKVSILTFVSEVSDPNHPNFVPVKDRIATFDNDGNLWSEQPLYFQLIFAMDRVKAMAPEHPEWKEEMPYKAILENDREALQQVGMSELMAWVMTTHTGNTAAEFEEIVQDWVHTARHPRFDQPYTALVYQPMLELLDYLRANEFKVFIVSGGGTEFMRAWVEDVYEVPKDQVVGSSIKVAFDENNGNPVIRRLPELNFIDDKAGKPVGIHEHIGRKPIFASGNSDGDLQMLQYSASHTYPSFQLILHHTDAEREWAYDRDSHIGKLDMALDEAQQKGWNVIDMKQDWKVVYPFEVETP